MTQPKKMQMPCPHCDKRLRYRAEHAGRSGKCQKCGGTVRLLGATSVATPAASEELPDGLPEERLPEGLPNYVGFNCTHCDTRLTAYSRHGGKRLKCPDCETLNVIPKPQPVAKPVMPVMPVMPAAMEGKQYELWGVDEAPLPAEMIANQPKLLSVTCKLCGTLMHVGEQRLGKKLVCPDCGTATRVELPKGGAKPLSEVELPSLDDGASESGAADDGEYEIDESLAPGPRPVPVPVAVREAERLHGWKEGADDPASGKSKKKKRRKEARQQPLKYPLLQRIPAMLTTTTVLVWWGGLSLVLAAILSMLGGGGGGASNNLGAVGTAMVMISMFVGGSIVGLLWLAAASSIWLAVLVESADGHDRLHHPPETNYLEWFGQLAFLVVAAVTSLIPGFALGKLALQLTPQAHQWQEIFAMGGWLVVFPVAILSSLEQGSPMAVFSPKLGKSFASCLPTWLLFYGETALFCFALLAATQWLTGKSAWWLLLLSPLWVAASMLYFRLLGRLAWTLSERTAVEIGDRG